MYVCVCVLIIFFFPHSFFLSVSLSVCFAIYLSICLSIYLSQCVHIYLSIYLLFVSFYLFVSIFHSVLLHSLYFFAFH